MQLDQDLVAALSALAGIASAFIGYGIVKEKVARLEAEHERSRQETASELKTLRNERRDYVTHQHLDAVIEPMRRTLEVVEKDVKEILHVVATRDRE